MRNIALIIGTLLFLSTIVYSQNDVADKGSIIISGTGSAMNQGGDLFENSDGERLTTIMLAPTFEYFIIDKLFIGGGLAFTRESQGDDSYSTIGVGPTVGWVIGQAESKKTYPYLATGIRYYSAGDDDDSISGTDIVVGGGIIITATDHLGIVFEAGYHIMNLKHKDWKESKSGDLIAVGIGIAGLLR